MYWITGQNFKQSWLYIYVFGGVRQGQEKPPRSSLKIVNTYLKQKWKNDSHCNSYNFSLLVPQPNKYVVVCICIIIFHVIYSPYPQIIFLWGINFFFNFVAKAWEYFKFLGELMYLGVLFSFFGMGAMPFSSTKPSVTNHVNSRTVDSKMVAFHTFTLEFSLWEFSVCSNVHWNCQKSFYFC